MTRISIENIIVFIFVHVTLDEAETENACVLYEENKNSSLAKETHHQGLLTETK